MPTVGHYNHHLVFRKRENFVCYAQMHSRISKFRSEIAQSTTDSNDDCALRRSRERFCASLPNLSKILMSTNHSNWLDVSELELEGARALVIAGSSVVASPFLAVNKCFGSTLGYTRSSLQGKSLALLGECTDLDRLQLAWSRALNGSKESIECVLYNKDQQAKKFVVNLLHREVERVQGLSTPEDAKSGFSIMVVRIRTGNDPDSSSGDSLLLRRKSFACRDSALAVAGNQFRKSKSFLDFGNEICQTNGEIGVESEDQRGQPSSLGHSRPNVGMTALEEQLREAKRAIQRMKVELDDARRGMAANIRSSLCSGTVGLTQLPLYGAHELPASATPAAFGPSKDIIKEFGDARAAGQPTSKPRRPSSALREAFPRAIAEAIMDGRRLEPVCKACVSVLFLDVVGFTALSAAMDAGRVSGLLDRLFIRLDALARLHGVQKVVA